MENDDRLTLNEAIAYTKLSKWSFNVLVRQGKIPFYRINRKTRLFSKRAIDKYMADNFVRVVKEEV